MWVNTLYISRLLFYFVSVRTWNGTVESLHVPFTWPAFTVSIRFVFVKISILAVIGQEIRDLSYCDLQLLRKVEFRDCFLSLVCSADFNTTNFNIRASFFFFTLQTNLFLVIPLRQRVRMWLWQCWGGPRGSPRSPWMRRKTVMWRRGRRKSRKKGQRLAHPVLP